MHYNDFLYKNKEKLLQKSFNAAEEIKTYKKQIKILRGKNKKYFK